MLTQQQIAEHLDLERSTVSRLVDRLNIDYRTASMDEIRIAYLRHLREMAAGRASETGIDLVAERAMTERVDREIKLLTLAEKKGQLVNAAQLEQAYGQMVGAFQTELLALSDVEIDLEWLNEHMYGCLEQLSGYDPDGSSGDSANRAATAPAGTDRDNGVGEEAPPDEREGNGEPRAL
ncbi:helix-turn-helix domain-containing protein [Burkholderia pseudomallei]|uniref:helix-turn-helix domain-containing protein n=1 Tax=Burkholderia pseudomallei TaxID=28450 RepID=UPI000F0839A3|nr:helix-turn-helix domain-containing protein [Burkholderia pseudomallei]